MRVLKIIQANPEIFNTDQQKTYSEIEAIRKIASMESKGNKIQKNEFEIRQRHTAIGNLFSLGFVESAVELAILLIPEAEKAHQFKIAQDLCDTLITHYYHLQDLESVRIYKSLYDKFKSNISFEHESLLLCSKVIFNHKKIPFVDFEEIGVLLEAIKKKLPLDRLWYHFFYYYFKSMVLDEEELENLYNEAITYFENLNFRHPYFIDGFSEGLILYYLKKSAFEKVESQLDLLKEGSISWFNNHLHYATTLLNQKDIKSNDICVKTMNHPAYIDLSPTLKEEWKSVYKASVRLLLNN